MSPLLQGSDPKRARSARSVSVLTPLCFMTEVRAAVQSQPGKCDKCKAAGGRLPLVSEGRMARMLLCFYLYPWFFNSLSKTAPCPLLIDPIQFQINEEFNLSCTHVYNVVCCVAASETALGMLKTTRQGGERCAEFFSAMSAAFPMTNIFIYFFIIVLMLRSIFQKTSIWIYIALIIKLERGALLTSY